MLEVTHGNGASLYIGFGLALALEDGEGVEGEGFHFVFAREGIRAQWFQTPLRPC